MPDYLVIDFHERSCQLCFFRSGKGQRLVFESSAFVDFSYPVAGTDVVDEGAGAEDDLGVVEKAEDANGAAIRSAIDALGCRAESTVVVVPKQWATLRLVRLPSSDRDELDEMARFEAERHIPFNAERHVVGYHVLSMDEVEGSYILLAALDGPPADRIASIVQAAGLKIAGIDISTLALTNVLRSVFPASEGESAVQVHVGRDSIDMVILLSGDPIFARSMPFGADKLALANGDGGGVDPVQRLTREVRRTLDYARREFECPALSEAFVSGRADVCGICVEAIREDLGLDARVLEYSGGFAVSDELELSVGDDGVEEPGEATACVGALIGHLVADAPSVDLTPDSYVSRVRFETRRRQAVIGGVVLAVLVVLFFIGTQSLLRMKKNELRVLEGQVAIDETEADKVRDMLSVVEIISGSTQREGSALAILDTLSEWDDLFSRDNMRVAITDFDYGVDQNVMIAGHALSYADLNTFVSRLKNCGHFRHAMIQNMPRRTAPNVNQQVVHFEVICYFKGDGGAQ